MLEPRPHGSATGLGRRFHGPIRAWAATTAAGWVVMASILIGLGLFLVAFLPEGIGAWDREISVWFADRRTDTLTDATSIGSLFGSTLVVVGVAVVVGIVLAIVRRWVAIAFLAAGMLIEVCSFLATTLVISRSRPAVSQLDVSPPTSSFPSGHTAAALVLYASIAIIVWTITGSRVVRAMLVVVAVMLPVVVAVSRVYRGMHHPTDVMGSLVLAAGSLACAIAVARVSAAAAERDSLQQALIAARTDLAPR